MTADTGHLTRKQINILETIMKGAENGDFIDMDQLLEKVSYETSKQSMQCSIRVLERRGLVERKPLELRRGRMRAVFALTPQALQRFDGVTGEFDVIIEGLEELLKEE